MRVTRVYVDAPLEAGMRVTLGGSAASHVTRVLRLRAGEALTVFNGRGGEYAASIDSARGGEVTVAVGEHRAIERESPLAITIVQGISRGDRMDLVVQKATELGVTRLVPVLTEHGVVRLDERQAERKVGHWRAIAIGACEQSGRNRAPEVARPVTLGEFLHGTAAAAPVSGDTRCARVMLSPAATSTIEDLGRPPGGAAVLIGPEGGLTTGEQEAALRAGFVPVRLGPRVLRTETAAIAALTVLQWEFGDV